MGKESSTSRTAVGMNEKLGEGCDLRYIKLTFEEPSITTTGLRLAVKTPVIIINHNLKRSKYLCCKVVLSGARTCEVKGKMLEFAAKLPEYLSVLGRLSSGLGSAAKAICVTYLGSAPLVPKLLRTKI